MQRFRRTWWSAAAGLLASLAVCIALAPRSVSAAPSPSAATRSSGGNFGLGVTLGDPMGVSAKLFLHPKHALQLDAGWMPLHHGSGGATFSYLWHPATIASNSTLDLVPYLGTGIGFSGRGIEAHHDHHLDHHHHHHVHVHHVHARMMCMQVRAPALGMALHFKPAPIDVAFEGGWSPCVVEAYSGGVRFSPAHGDVSAKVRFWF